MVSLPIDDILPELLQTVRTAPAVILSAPPGAGKTTRVPLALLDVFPPGSGRIIMLEPRRIAAVASARYMAGQLEEPVGQTVGYSIRFERRVSPRTRIEVLTEGMLTRRLQDDPSLTGVACVIFDEFHERSLHADLGLALCLESQAVLRPDLKLLVMSATLDVEPLARLLGDAPVVRSAGRSFPVQIRHLSGDERDRLPRRMAVAIRQALATEEGDLLAFLPGSGEIRAVERELGAVGGLQVCPLYGDLSVEQQQRAILPGPKRRVVLATSIAETSLTIDGVRVVLDCGLSRRQQYDPANGLDRLVTVRSSQASALQRSGRAGRTAPGVCLRLYSAHTFSAMTPHTPPEIRTADLAPLLLELAAWGSPDPRGLRWLEVPSEAALAAAAGLLRMLGAMDQSGKITSLGREMVRYPLHPRLARLLLEGKRQGMTAVACRVAALLADRDPLRREAAQLCDSDLTARLEFLADHARDDATLRIRRVEQQLLRLAGGDDAGDSAVCDAACLAPLLLVAWPDRLARRRAGREDDFLLASGRGARLSRYSGVRRHDWLVALQVDGGNAAEGLIHLASGVTAGQARSAVPGLLEQVRQVSWDDAAGRVCAVSEERIGVVVLASRQVEATDQESARLLVEQVWRRGLALLNWSEAARSFQGRVQLAARLLPEEGWPDLSDSWLLEHLPDWLEPHLTGLRSRQDLGRIDLQQILRDTVPWKLLATLDTVVPASLTVPSGRSIRIDYSNPEEPVLAVKLQELFGLADSPAVCRGRMALLVHLLSPAGRPVAITRDLKGFWERGYPEVRKELRGRYPKHPWPDDPWNAPATRLTKRRFSEQM